MKSRTLLSLIAFIAFGVFADIQVEDFTAFEGEIFGNDVSSTDPGPKIEVSQTPNVIGGERYTHIEYSTSSEPDAWAGASFRDEGPLEYTAQYGIISILYLNWGNTIKHNGSDLNANFSDVTGFRLQFGPMIAGDLFDAHMRVWSDGTVYQHGAYSIGWEDNITEIFFDRDDFNLFGASLSDWGSIDGIELELRPVETYSEDDGEGGGPYRSGVSNQTFISLDALETVPEPASAGLILIGTLGLFGIRRLFYD